jgi:hypothetical protein
LPQDVIYHFGLGWRRQSVQCDESSITAVVRTLIDAQALD